MSESNKLRPEFWIDRYGDYLYNYAFMRVNKVEAARDLVQDTFLAGLKSVKSYRGEAAEKTWLVSILKKKIIDFYRKASNRLEVSSTDQKIFPVYSHYFNGEEEGRGGHWRKDAGPEEWKTAAQPAESKEFMNILSLCLRKLPEKWSAIFNLRLFEEQNADMICKEMDITPSNYWVIMHRARLQLRECLEKNWFGNK